MIKYFLTYILLGFLKIFSVIFRLFPISKSRIVFITNYASLNRCNFKYINNYLNKYRNQFNIVWVMRGKWSNPPISKNQNIFSIYKLKSIYYICTASCCITNYSFGLLGILKRQKQLYLDTWHGGGCYKKVGIQYTDNTLVGNLKARINDVSTDYYISTSKFFTDYVIRKCFGFKGKVLDYGFPRNDIFFEYHPEIVSNIKKRYNIPEDYDIVLYAPTYNNNNIEYEVLNFSIVEKSYEQRFNRKCKCLYRFHYMDSRRDLFVEYDNASDYEDMQELLYATDLLITDYSSSIWDFSITKKPCILFTPDLEVYNNNRGFCKSIYEWGFPICETNQNIKDCILNFDLKLHADRMAKHHIDLGSYENGNAAQKTVDFLIDYINKV